MHVNGFYYLRRRAMDRKVKELKTGVRLNIRKPPKAEVPKNIYNRKLKHKKGHENEKSWPFFLSPQQPMSHLLIKK